MRILFALAEPYLPEVVGGGPLDVHQLALQLGRRGHQVHVATGRAGRSRLLGYRLAQKVSGEHLITRHGTEWGYPVTRVGTWLLPALVDQLLSGSRFDLVVTQGRDTLESTKVAVQHEVPTLVRVIAAGTVADLAHEAAADPELSALLTHPRARFVANSTFIAGKVGQQFGASVPVVYPLVDLGDIRARERVPQRITFINPHPAKGLEVALEVARLLAHRKFCFVRAWPLSRGQRRDLVRDVQRLPNVELLPPTPHMAQVYGQASLVLMPSQVEEAFGRVALEAGVNRVPVVASKIGGIPEALGDGGVLVAPGAPAREWAEAIETVLGDDAESARLAAAGYAHATQAKFGPDAVVASLLDAAGTILPTGTTP